MDMRSIKQHEQNFGSLLPENMKLHFDNWGSTKNVLTTNAWKMWELNHPTYNLEKQNLR